MPAKTMEELATQLKSVRFRKKLLGGVDEADVWKTFNALNTDYQAIFDAETERSAALLAERDDEIRRLKAHAQSEPEKLKPRGKCHA